MLRHYFLRCSLILVFTTGLRGQSCPIQFELTDSFGDGWNGARVSVYQNNLVIDSLGWDFTIGSLHLDTLTLVDSLPIIVELSTPGTWPSEIGLNVYNLANQTLIARYTPQANAALGDTLVNVMLYCTGGCAPPDSLFLIGQSCASLIFDSSSTQDTLLVEYGLQGFNRGMGLKDTLYSSPYLFGGLTTGQDYDFYFNKQCGTDSSLAYPITERTSSGPLPNAQFSYVSYFIGNQEWFKADGSASTNADSFRWDFGNGLVTNNGPVDSVSYLGNGIYHICLTVTNSCGWDSLCLPVYPNDMPSFFLAERLRMYPSPANDFILLESELINSQAVYIQISDIHGRVVLKRTVAEHNAYLKQRLDIAHLASGLYTIKVSQGLERINGSIIINH